MGDATFRAWKAEGDRLVITAGCNWPGIVCHICVEHLGLMRAREAQRLIANAPEMLVELQKVLAYLENRSDCDLRGEDWVTNAENRMLAELGDGLRAVVARATGSAS